MKFKKFVIQYHYQDGRDYLHYVFFDTFVEAMQNVCDSFRLNSDVCGSCVSLIIKSIEFEL